MPSSPVLCKTTFFEPCEPVTHWAVSVFSTVQVGSCRKPKHIQSKNQKGFQQHCARQLTENQLRPFPSVQWDVVCLCCTGIYKLAAAWAWWVAFTVIQTTTVLLQRSLFLCFPVMKKTKAVTPVASAWPSLSGDLLWASLQAQHLEWQGSHWLLVNRIHGWCWLSTYLLCDLSQDSSYLSVFFQSSGCLDLLSLVYIRSLTPWKGSYCLLITVRKNSCLA